MILNLIVCWVQFLYVITKVWKFMLIHLLFRPGNCNLLPFIHKTCFWPFLLESVMTLLLFKSFKFKLITFYIFYWCLISIIWNLSFILFKIWKYFLRNLWWNNCCKLLFRLFFNFPFILKQNWFSFLFLLYWVWKL